MIQTINPQIYTISLILAIISVLIFCYNFIKLGNEKMNKGFISEKENILSEDEQKIRAKRKNYVIVFGLLTIIFAILPASCGLY